MCLLENVTVEPYGGVEYHKGTLASKQVVVCCAGVKPRNTPPPPRVLIRKFGAEKIIFSGIAGNMTSKIGIGDVVIGKTVLYHDAPAGRGLPEPALPEESPGDPELIAAAERPVPRPVSRHWWARSPPATCLWATGATKAAIEAKCAPDCVEMEGAAVARSPPRARRARILRAMSGNADEGRPRGAGGQESSASQSTLPPPRDRGRHE